MKTIITSIILLIVYSQSVFAGETWICTEISFSTEVLVKATINDDVISGTITVAGKTHKAKYQVEGFDRRWDFGSILPNGLYNYSFVIEPNGKTYYYDFKYVDKKGVANSAMTFHCKEQNKHK